MLVFEIVCESSVAVEIDCQIMNNCFVFFTVGDGRAEHRCAGLNQRGCPPWRFNCMLKLFCLMLFRIFSFDFEAQLACA